MAPITQQQQDALCRGVEAVRRRMDAALAAACRAPGEVLLCAASKTRDADTVAFAAGLAIDLFGENHVQELVQKSAAGAYGAKPCHMIGHLQTNKIRQAVGCGMIQSVDREKLILGIEAEAAKRGVCQDILLEVNIGGEASKSGATAGALDALLELAAGCAHLRLRGLMTIPPPAESEGQARQYFAAVRALYERLAPHCPASARWDTLSMGMSDDFAAAIAEGATMVRVGTGIFGPRQYPKAT